MTAPAARIRNSSSPVRIRSLAIAIALFLALFLLQRNLPEVLGGLGLEDNQKLLSNSSLAIRTLLWLIGTHLLNRFLHRFVWDGLVQRALGRPVPGVLKELAALVVYLVAITCIVGFVYERSITAFLAALGAGGVVIGFALRNLLSDLFTGLAVNIDGNFAIGDWLSVPSPVTAGETIGQIEEIGWRCTRLSTEEGTTVVIPNSVLGMDKVTNISRPIQPTRYEASVNVDYSVTVERVRGILLNALKTVQAEDGFVDDRDPRVLVEDSSKFGVEYRLRYWITPWAPLSPTVAQDLVMTAVLEHLHIAGITPAYPKTDVYHASLPERHIGGHSTADRVALLSRISLFRKLQAAELEKLASELHRRKLDPKEVLFRQHDRGDSLFIVIEGLLDVLIDIKGTGAEDAMAQLSPGEFFGEMSLLTGAPRTATISSRTPSVLYEITRESILELIEDRPDISQSFSRAVAERQVALDEARSRADAADREVEVETVAGQIFEKMKGLFRKIDAREAISTRNH